jgi:hypothetical protein
MLLIASKERRDCCSPSPHALSSVFSSDGSDLSIPSIRFVCAEHPTQIVYRNSPLPASFIHSIGIDRKVPLQSFAVNSASYVERSLVLSYLYETLGIQMKYFVEFIGTRT